MFVRISTFKFPNQTKADAFSELYKNTLMEKYIKNTKIIKLFSFRPGEGKVTGIAFYKSLKDYELTESEIKEEVSNLIDKAYSRAKDILKIHKNKLVELAELLLEKEVIYKENLENIFGKREWTSFEEEKLNEIDNDATAKKSEKDKSA